VKGASMSYAIVRVQKFSSGSVMGVQIHDRREKYVEGSQTGISHTNKDIDWSRTHLNYDVAQCSLTESKLTENKQAEKQKSFHQIIKDRIKSLDLKKAVRKDAVVLAQCLVTSDHEFFEKMSPEQTEKFFKDSFTWLCNRYGKENVVSSTVHMDERTPHMHFNFVPVTPDGRLSAKSVLTRKSLIEQQDLFVLEVGSKYGLERGQEGGNKIHLEVAEYKLKTKKQDLQHTEELLNHNEEQLNLLKIELRKHQRELTNIQTAIAPLQGKKEELEQELKILGAKALDIKEIQSIQPKKGFGGGLKDVSMEDFQSLKQMAIDYIFTKRDLDSLQEEHEKVKNSARVSLDTYSRVNSLEKQNDELQATVRGMNSIINSNPELKELYNSVLDKAEKKALDHIQKSHHHAR